MQALEKKLEMARKRSWSRFGKQITFYVPGMIRWSGPVGRYPAISITGYQCALDCDHCHGKLLESMTCTKTPDELVSRCLDFRDKGNVGVLISGGCDENGELPWKKFIPAIRKIKQETGLYISVHSGIIDFQTALSLKGVGVDQALIDVVGDDQTYLQICHVPFGVSRIIASMKAMQDAGLAMVPHIVCGLFYGKIQGEKKAVHIISEFNVDRVVIVSVMKLPGINDSAFILPAAADVADIIAETRICMPDTQVSLGCARQRGNREIERLAIDAGVNRMALPSEEAVEHARSYGLEVFYQPTCCSVSQDISYPFNSLQAAI